MYVHKYGCAEPALLVAMKGHLSHTQLLTEFDASLVDAGTTVNQYRTAIVGGICPILDVLPADLTRYQQH
ncbi:hypothetical protein [Mycolicibacterium obuense]|jgi:hypothetical protein|uniref:Uncharacterized protein n=2 Tax=Mycolicibacterium TaxID=1866885 RepID=A0A0M2JTZ7_9MYCO|nr:hypothetical protein [Mycolicibacterium obuense]KKE98285.1 hypothetical protein WN67_30085 [Mycolicibacterium obuense]OAN31844.1 hypothetical protein A4X20_28810 [Mycolicibacterium iranicum]